MRYRNSITFLLLPALVAGCASPLKTDTVSFMPPSSYQNHQMVNGLEIAVVPIVSEQKSDEIFGTDMKEAEILPVHLVVQNSGNDEFEINSQQIFGISPNGEYTVAYNLIKAAEHVRGSSIGTTAVAGATAGAVVGAAVGAAVGAGVGHASGNSSTGAQSGAIIGGAVGATSGAAAGLSDSFTIQFKKELSNLAFEDQVIYPGDIKQGFIYLKWKSYTKIRMKVFNITTNDTSLMEFNVHVVR